MAELVDRIQVAWATLMDLVSPLSGAQLTTAGPPDGWAVKDHLVHIADWERASSCVLRREPQASRPGRVMRNASIEANPHLLVRARAAGSGLTAVPRGEAAGPGSSQRRYAAGTDWVG